MKTIAIIYGWAGGPKLSKLFRRELNNAGYRVVKNPYEADIIFAHSIGCFMLPGRTRAGLIFLLNPPYWPSVSIFSRWRKMSKDESRFLMQTFGAKRLLRVVLWGVFYVITNPRHTFKLLSDKNSLDFINKLENQKIIVVRNSEDPYCSPKIRRALEKSKNVLFDEIKGYHSDYYTNPEPYIKLIQSEYERG